MNIPNNTNKPLSKRQRTHLKKLIEEYGRSRAEKYYAEDQGWGAYVKEAQEIFEEAEKALFSYLDKLTEE